MKKISIIIIASFLSMVLSSCGAVKEGFTNQKKKSTDEFLVEKKAPLVMPPNYNELPNPKQGDEEEISDASEVKKLISKSKNSSSKNTNFSNSDESLENKILGKIKSN